MPSFFQKVGLYFARGKVSFANTLLFFGVNYNLPRVQRFALSLLPNLQVTMTKAAVSPSPSLARKLLATQAIQARLIEDDNALLRWAIENNQELVVDLLLNNDTVKNTLNNNDNALLVWAVANNFETYWKKLVVFKNVVDQLMSYANKYRFPTLYWAAANNHQNLFDYMIQKDCDINSLDFYEIFDQAIQSNNLSCIKHLIKNYINRLFSDEFKHLFKDAVELLGYIATIKDSAFVRELLTHDVFYNTLATEGNKFLLNTIARNQHDISKFLLTMPPVRAELTRQYADNLEQNEYAIKLFQSIAANQELLAVFKSELPGLDLDLDFLKITTEPKKPAVREIFNLPKIALPLTFSRTNSTSSSPVEESNNEQVNARPASRSRGISLD